ncbi:MAG: peptidase and in, kexin, sedolisin [Bryobacterales bacterium]|nr:peptidase and in, kexin, sedolisin [Bryobacterales bacterium]
MSHLFRILVVTVLGAAVSFAQAARNRYALILEDSPVTSQFSKERMGLAEAANYGRSLEQRQQSVRAELAQRRIKSTGSVTALMNAVFVVASADSVADLKNIPGVKGVVPIRTYRRKLNRATALVNAPAAWSAAGGVDNAGAGVKIAILDTGIDQQHPAFQDASLPMPAGYPRCNGGDCAFTNNKVIVARSYVAQLAAGSSSANPAADSRPDDYSARDRVGHGTAVASAAAGHSNTGLVTFSGVAPKAYLGNYKIYGSPEVNDFTTDDVIIQALDDAIKDGMDIVSFSSGGPSFTGALDTGASCGQDPGVPCDLSATAFENAAKAGMVIVTAAGNEGQNGNNFPTFNSISSPGDAPSVIAVGATTNSHTFVETVDVPGRGDLHNLAADPGDSVVPPGVIRAPLVNVSIFGGGALGCSAFPAYSLAGTIALIQRGTCGSLTKAQNAANAGAAGVILYLADTSPAGSPFGLYSLGIPVVLISHADGQALLDYEASTKPALADINPHGIEIEAVNSNVVVGFSSIGPSADANLKPDVVAVGGNANNAGSIYMATQKYDPLGDMYSADGYAIADGTSFATPLVSGAAALVKQRHPGFTAAQVRSAVVNSASSDVTHDDSGTSVDVRWLGAGKLSAGGAVAASVTAEPATISFGSIQPSTMLPLTRTFIIKNSGTANVSLALAATAAGSNGAASVIVTPPSVSLAAGGAAVATVTLSGSAPAAGVYSGGITVQGGSNALRIPYLFFGPSGGAANLMPLSGDFFDGVVGGGSPDGLISIKVVDAFGLPVSGVPVTWSAASGASVLNGDTVTDSFGVAGAQPFLGPQPGSYFYRVTAGSMRYTFTGFARQQPVISSIVDGATLQPGAFAPGSYITIKGSGLSDATDVPQSATHPLAIDFVSVSFDVPSAQISVPGHLIYASPTQINVEVPWELQGQTAAQVKVNVNFSPSNVTTISLTPVAPAFFEVAGNVAARDLSFHVINASNPAQAGATIQLYANGLGSVTNQPASGDPAPAGPFAETPTPVVTIGTQQAQVRFSGLTPGVGGLYALNVVVPQLAPGVYPITVSIGGRTSPASSIVVH